MSNQERAELCRQLERIEKRVTALQQLGIDVSSLTSQLSMARELMSDEKYNDAQIFCEELIALADHLAVDTKPEQSQDLYVQQKTERFTQNNIKGETVTRAIDSGLVGQLIDNDTVAKLLPNMENTALIRSIVQNVSEKVLSQLHEQDEGFEHLRIEQALRRSIEGQAIDAKMDDMGGPENDIIHWLVHSLTTGAISNSIESFTSHLEWQLQHMLQERTQTELQGDQVNSARIIPSQSQGLGGLIVDEYDERENISENQDDSGVFSDLPQIPKAGESWDEDPNFSANNSNNDEHDFAQESIVDTGNLVPDNFPDSDSGIEGGIEGGIESSVDDSESETYEPATGSTLRPNTSVFTEVNAMQSPQVPIASEVKPPEAQSPDLYAADTASIGDEAFKAISDLVARQKSTVTQVAANGSIDKKQLKHYLRDALPELLQEDDIKQAIFAALAVEVLCKPSVLGSMTGLRDYMRQELLSVQEQMQGSEN
ncbi:MAG: hypothetical protein HRU15_01955 [Planctomycetes bacterium]|nr:hypothetical protein [Planctomycetota bacterium]